MRYLLNKIKKSVNKENESSTPNLPLISPYA